MTAHRATEIGAEHKSLVNTIVEYLESQILEGLLEPGQRVIEQHVCDQLKVSRVPLREAFRILENRRFQGLPGRPNQRCLARAGSFFHRPLARSSLPRPS